MTNSFQDGNHSKVDPEERQTLVVVADILSHETQPSAWELLASTEERVGSTARLHLRSVLDALSKDSTLTGICRAYCRTLLASKDLTDALQGTPRPGGEIHSTIDSLIARSRIYRDSSAFAEMVSFMGKFKNYAPYNNMLVRLQNPSCGFYATEVDWMVNFKRVLKDDAHPMLILAPRHPVLLVYDIDQTDGPQLPEKLKGFATFDGDWDQEWLTQLIANANRRYLVEVRFTRLSSTHAGSASYRVGSRPWKRSIRIHEELDEPSQFGVLCHELAHVLLGHTGGDPDGWWPSRINLDHATKEIEAEAVAYIATTRFGLSGSSAAYVSSHLPQGPVPAGVSLDHIAKVAGRIETMTRTNLPQRRPGTNGRRPAEGGEENP